MRKLTAGFALVIVTLLTFVVPPQAHAARTWVIRAGASAANQADQALWFLPKTITIDAGDSIQWKLAASEHTIYFPAGHNPPALAIPGKTKGQMLWNPAVFFASPQQTYDGSGPVSGGALLVDPQAPKSYTLTFTKPGTYKYLCMFHPGMEGTVVVQPAGAAYPMTQAQYDQAGAAAAEAALAKAAALRSAGKAVVTVSGGKRTYTLNMIGSVKDGATYYRFPVQTLTVHRGDTVVWAMDDPTEIHTVSFGVGNRPFDIATMVPAKQGPPTLLVTPNVAAPAGGSAHHGPGFYNSGFMATEGPGFVKTYGLTFTKAGTFEYLCAVHDDFGMKATVVVR